MEELKDENQKLKQLLEAHKIEVPEHSRQPRTGDIVSTIYGKAQVVERLADGTLQVVSGEQSYKESSSNVEILERFGDSEYRQLRDKFLQRAGTWSSADESASAEQSRTVDEDYEGIIYSSDEEDLEKKKRLLPFTGTTQRITPANVPLALSPLSDLPEKVAAYGNGSVEWLASNMPKEFKELEDERFKCLNQQGEIVRLTGDLERAECKLPCLRRFLSIPI